MKQEYSEQQPLAEQIRPAHLDDFVGQSHLLDKIQTLQTAKRLASLCFFGPPGCGKSTLAILLAQSSGLPWVRVSAPESRLGELRKKLPNIKILILDELHRFSKAQQDFFLPLLETGEIILLASTTENPSFAVTRQLLSRLHVLRFHSLNREELLKIIERACIALNFNLNEQSQQFLCSMAGGDARTVLNLLEYTAQLPIQEQTPEKLMQTLPDIIIRGDRDGDSHYELTSAMIKSIRGSDPDAALYWLTCLIESGEDPRFIARRLIISASEDIGLADPTLLPLAVACRQAVEFIGMPEGAIPLAETCIALALAPKSNSSYLALRNAQKNVRYTGPLPVPLHLRNASTALQKKWGYGQGYKYPHSYPSAWVKQQYLPDKLVGTTLYEPKNLGFEAKLTMTHQLRKKQ